jgi:TldD protein
LQAQLRNATQAEAYAGPAILSPTAAAVFFHEIFGHRIEGHRLKYSFDSQTFKTQVGSHILPKYINIYSDPTLKYFGGKAMFGNYRYDDQGIPAQRVTVVENGVLRNFLMSRTPIEGFNQSNGHGRSQVGKMPVSRQTNLIVEARKSYSEKELRKKLIAECKRQKKSYGLYFKEVIGGFTQTSRYSPNVFNVTPTVVYKIYVDGRPDELVKGVDFIGTPLAIFSEIMAMGNETGVFTGYCGAESGSIPVTATSPALLIRKIETQKKPEGFTPQPVLNRPR